MYQTQMRLKRKYTLPWKNEACFINTEAIITADKGFGSLGVKRFDPRDWA